MELTTVLYLVDKLNIANWLKLKKQLLLKYGNDWMEKVESKKKNVDAKVLEFVEFKVVVEDCVSSCSRRRRSSESSTRITRIL